ncbi:MAG: dihydropteroate synthase [Proteobacteria bacterium]|nr:dihydropteroate synthase [Burkholderiales bacterium]
MVRYWRCGRFRISLDVPRLMGVINVTPDSFSDGGRFFDPAKALAHARMLVDDGADILDVGGESTRPGAAEVSEREELGRVLPVVDGLAGATVAVSIDTAKPAVMRAAIAAGASIVNDIHALRAPGALEVIAQSQVGVCVMHMQGTPRTMQREPRYDDVVGEVLDFLAERVDALLHAGITRDRIAIDPGIGFGKTLAHNLALLRALPRMHRLDCAVLVGLSRKSMLGALTGRATEERQAASLGGALWCVLHGADIIRVHDVRETRDALAVWQGLSGAPSGMPVPGTGSNPTQKKIDL